MQKYTDVVQDITGNAVPGATVTIKVSPGGATATIYSTNTGTSQSNPITTDADGRFTFYAKDGSYYASVSKTGITGEDGPVFTLKDATGYVSAKGYGAVGDGTTDDTTAINAALAANKYVFLPEGTYYTSGALACTLAGQKLIGAGTTATTINVNSTSAKGITIATGLNNVELCGFTLTRTGTAASGAEGISCGDVTIGQALIHNLVVEKHYNGLALGPTDYSTIRDVITQKNINDGINITNTASDGSCQWSIEGGVLSQKNGRDGVRLVSIAGPSQMTVGSIRGLSTFANTGRGAIYLGLVGVPIQGIRLADSFLGEDGDSECYIDSYGGQHQINNVAFELAGTRTTGPTLATAASNTGHGLNLTSNNDDVLVNACHASGNSLNGFAMQATVNTMVGCQATNNGVAATAAQANGVRVLGTARCTIVGGRFGNRTGTLQKYGLYAADGSKISITGTDLSGNDTAYWNIVSNEASIIAVGNFRADARVALSPSGAVTIGAAVTGDWNAAGTLNVSGGLLKNDTAYTNP